MADTAMSAGAVAVVLQSVWVMLPAYVPNNLAVVTGGGTPIDFGATWGGQRLLGDGKTWRGFAGGVAGGALLAVLLDAVHATAGATLGVDLVRFGPAPALVLPTGAMLGDVVASFGKRRAGFARGRPVPGLDQLDFVGGALGLAALLVPRWFASALTLPMIVVVVVATPLLHLATNATAYLAGLKDEPY
ncbi:MAG: CDP-2,3-bis-(O-geranylgeranyl)-sn-glycerol synthase [Halobacteriaceae archaeon]